MRGRDGMFVRGTREGRCCAAQERGTMFQQPALPKQMAAVTEQLLQSFLFVSVSDYRVLHTMYANRRSGFCKGTVGA